MVVVTGAGGQVGGQVVRAAAGRNVACRAFDRAALDITDAASIEAALATLPPNTVVLNLAAYTSVDGAETERDTAFRANARGPAALAAACASSGRCLVHVSTDYVFDGRKDGAYVETDAVGPLNVYGASKVAGENAVRDMLDEHLIVRTSWVFSGRARNFPATMLRLAQAHDVVRVVSDEIGCPTPADRLAEVLLTLAGRATTTGFRDWGTYHCSGRPAVSRADYARAIYAAAERAGGLATARVEDIPGDAFPTPAVRPRRSVLDCGKLARVFGIGQPDWRADLDRAMREAAGDRVG